MGELIMRTARILIAVATFVGAFTLMPRLRPDMEHARWVLCQQAFDDAGRSTEAERDAAFDRVNVLCLDDATKLHLFSVGMETVEAAELPSATADRAPVTLHVSPKERYFVWYVIRDIKVQGEDQEAFARVWESLALDETSKTVEDASKKKKSIGEIENGFSEKPEKRTIGRDDAGRLAKWLKADGLPGSLVIALRPVRRSLEKIADGKDPGTDK